MRCERARELIDPYVDEELGSDDRALVTAHIASCASCRELTADIGRVKKAVAAIGREPVPKALASRIRSSLASEAQGQERGKKTGFLFWRVPTGALGQAAALAASCALSILLTWWVVTSTGEAKRLEQEVLAAHVRSLLQDSPIQVASSDAHAVKPWFAGRVDFAPDVKDLTAEGFPLLGGRLDYIRQRRVGALVYQRRLHIVNVFMWPAANAEEDAPKLLTKNGYNLLAWSKSGVTYWAISDLDAGELKRLQSLL